MNDKNNTLKVKRYSCKDNMSPKRIFKSRESSLIYSGIKNSRYDIEYILKSEAVKHIRAVWEKYKKIPAGMSRTEISEKYGDEFWIAIEADVKQANGKNESHE